MLSFKRCYLQGLFILFLWNANLSRVLLVLQRGMLAQLASRLRARQGPVGLGEGEEGEEGEDEGRMLLLDDNCEVRLFFVFLPSTLERWRIFFARVRWLTDPGYLDYVIVIVMGIGVFPFPLFSFPLLCFPFSSQSLGLGLERGGASYSMVWNGMEWYGMV